MRITLILMTAVTVAAIGVAVFGCINRGSGTVQDDSRWGELQETLRALDRTLARLSTALEKQESGTVTELHDPGVSRIPVLSPDVEQLAAVIRELQATVREWKDFEQERRASKTPQQLRTSFPKNMDAVRAQFLVPDDQRTQEHLLWTHENVLQHYGIPDQARIVQDGGVKWDYVDVNGERLIFWFYQGTVVRVIDS